MLRKPFCMLVAVVATAVFFPLTVLVLLLTLRPGLTVWVARALWSPVLLWAGGARVRVEGAEHVDARRPTIYVANHQSALDIPVLFRAVPINFRFVAKSELAWVPLIGWYLWLAGHVFVNRGHRQRAIASLDRAAAQIRRGTSVVIFPEGTRSPDGRVLPFKKGPFALALKAGVAVVPVTVEGTGAIMPKSSWDIRPGEVRVRIGAPIDASRFAEGDREGLARAVRDQVIVQSLAIGGPGGDRETVVAAAGAEGRARRSA